MGKMTRIGWCRLDAWLAEVGESGVLDTLCGRMSLGEAPHEVSVSMGMPWHVLRKWMEEDEKRMDAMALAKRCYADKLAWEAVGRIGEADVETVGLAKFRFEAGMKMAGKLDRSGWGEEKDVSRGGGDITVVINGFGTEPPCIVPALEGDVVEVLDAGN